MNKFFYKVFTRVLNYYYEYQAKQAFKGAELNAVNIGPELNKWFEIRYPERLKIGYKTAISGDCFINAYGGVEIGKYCHIAKGLTIYSHNHNWKSEDTIPYDGKSIVKPVKIGDCVWIGANVSIAPGAEIGDGVIVSCGSVVFGKIPKCAIIRGNPAHVVGYRDELLFNKLYNEGKFA